MEGWKWSLSTGVDCGKFTCIEGGAPRHAWELGGWVADRALWDVFRQMHTIGYNGGNTYNARNCEISIIMKIFLLYFRYWDYFWYSQTRRIINAFSNVLYSFSFFLYRILICQPSPPPLAVSLVKEKCLVQFEALSSRIATWFVPSWNGWRPAQLCTTYVVVKTFKSIRNRCTITG